MFAAAALLLCTAGCRDEGVGRWVDPNIGGVAPLLTTVMPQVHRPHAMVRIYPVTEPGLNDRYFSDRIYGIALNMPRYRNGAVTAIMPTAGDVSFAPRRGTTTTSRSCIPGRTVSGSRISASGRRGRRPNARPSTSSTSRTEIALRTCFSGLRRRARRAWTGIGS